jgi:hypothetical protein
MHATCWYVYTLSTQKSKGFKEIGKYIIYIYICAFYIYTILQEKTSFWIILEVFGEPLFYRMTKPKMESFQVTWTRHRGWSAPGTNESFYQFIWTSYPRISTDVWGGLLSRIHSLHVLGLTGSHQRIQWGVVVQFLQSICVSSPWISFKDSILAFPLFHPLLCIRRPCSWIWVAIRP